MSNRFAALFAWRNIHSTPEALAESLTVEALPYEEIPALHWPAVRAFRKLRSDARVVAAKSYLERADFGNDESVCARCGHSVPRDGESACGACGYDPTARGPKRPAREKGLSRRKIREFTEFQTRTVDLIEILRSCADELDTHAEHLNSAIKEHGKTLRRSGERFRALANEIEREFVVACPRCRRLRCKCIVVE